MRNRFEHRRLGGREECVKFEARVESQAEDNKDPRVPLLSVASVFERLLASAVEDVLGKIPLGGIGDNGHNAFAWAQPRRDLNRCKDVCSSAGATQHPFFAR
jgi:hypothetical protein